MLQLQTLLMLVSTLAALRVVGAVRVVAAAASLALNLTRRGREVSNLLLVISLAWCDRRWRTGS